MERDVADNAVENNERVVELRRALPRDDFRYLFLSIFVMTNLASVSAHFISMDLPSDMKMYLWSELILLIRQRPTLSPLASQLDGVELFEAIDSLTQSAVTQHHALGYGLIDLAGVLHRTQIRAWAILLQVQKAAISDRVHILRAAADTLHQLLNFVLAQEGKPWRLSDFYRLGGEESLRQILIELKGKHLTLIDDSHELCGIAKAPGDRVFVFTHGVIRRSRYVVVPPVCAYFTNVATLSAITEWNENPISYALRNLNQIPTSHYVTQIRVELEDINEVILGARLHHWALQTVEELSPEFVALGIIEALHLPHICGPFLAAIIHRVCRFMRHRTASKN